MKSEADDFLGVSESDSQEIREKIRYPALRVIAGIYRGIAVLAGIAAIVILFIGFMKLDSYGDEAFGLMLILGSIFGGAITVITCLATAEGIKVFLDIEENTRNSYHAIWNHLNR